MESTVVIVIVIFMTCLLFECLLQSHTFQTSPNKSFFNPINTAIYDDVTGFLSEAVNAIEDKWTAFKRELEPGSLAAKGEEIMNSMKELVGLDVARDTLNE